MITVDCRLPITKGGGESKSPPPFAKRSCHTPSNSTAAGFWSFITKGRWHEITKDHQSLLLSPKISLFRPCAISWSRKGKRPVSVQVSAVQLLVMVACQRSCAPELAFHGKIPSREAGHPTTRSRATRTDRRCGASRRFRAGRSVAAAFPGLLGVPAVLARPSTSESNVHLYHTSVNQNIGTKGRRTAARVPPTATTGGGEVGPMGGQPELSRRSPRLTN